MTPPFQGNRPRERASEPRQTTDSRASVSIPCRIMAQFRWAAQPFALPRASCTLMMDREPDEYELALRARGGDWEALAELVERTRLRLFALAYADLRHYEDAQDAVASALLRICLHVGELREPARVHAWMNAIVRNEIRQMRRGPAAE